MTKKHAKTFYFAARFLPQAKRRAVFAVYAFCRFIETGIQTSTSSTSDHPQQKNHLKECALILDRIYGHQSSYFSHSFEPALEQTISRYAIPRKWFSDLIEGMIFDHHFVQPENDDQLLAYCYHVSGCVALIIHLILSPTQDRGDEAIALGHAIQLTVITRDIPSDALRNRLRLPLSWCEESGLTLYQIQETLRGQANNPQARLALQTMQTRLIDHADKLYQIAMNALADIPADGSRLYAALIACHYRGILNKIRKQQKKGPLSAPRLNFFEKVSRLPQAFYMAKRV